MVHARGEICTSRKQDFGGEFVSGTAGSASTLLGSASSGTTYVNTTPMHDGTAVSVEAT